MKKIEDNDFEHEDFEEYCGQIEVTWNGGEKTIEKVEKVNSPVNDPMSPEDDYHVQLVLEAEEWIGCSPMIFWIYDNPQDTDCVEGKWRCNKIIN